MKKWFVLTMVMACIASVCVTADAAPPARYRDLKVYTTSAPHPSDANRIVATMQLVNNGKQPLDVIVALEPDQASGFGGTKFLGRIEPGKQAPIAFDLKPPADFKRSVLRGSIGFDGEGKPADRELYVAVQGPDPADFNDKWVTKITAKAEVVGTHAPRTVESVAGAVQQMQGKNAPGGPAVVLAEGGATKYQVELSAPEDPALAEAVADLQHVFKQVAEATLPLVKGDPAKAVPSPAVRIRLATNLPNWPHAEAYRLTAGPDDVVIEAPNVDGLRNGVYSLVTDHLDCHWFVPKRLGEELPAPADKSIRIRRVTETKGPSFFSSPSMSWSSAPRWDRQNRAVINRGRMNFGHAWQNMLTPAQFPYDKFPDMWSRDRSGKVQQFDSNWSATNFCTTSPEVLKIVAEKINAQFDANPDAIVASLDPNDLAPMCQCDRCLAVDAMYGVKPDDDKQMADRLLHFTKEIHGRLKPEHKPKYLGVLAYGFQTRPPKKAVPIPQFATTACQFPSYFDHTRPFNDPTSSYNRDFHEIVKGWGSRVKQLGFYDYYGHYNFFGPWGILHKIREDMPAFKELGGTFVVIESQPNFAMHGLNLYVAARLVWDIDADVDAVAEEYVTKFYGPAASPMRDFYRATERHYALTRPGTQAALRVARDPEFWRETDEHLKRAEAAVAAMKDGPGKRFADRIAFTRDGYTFGKLMFELEGRRGQRVDVAKLQEAKPVIAQFRAKYEAANDDYWPTLTPTYFWPDIDAMLKEREKSPG